MYKIGAFILGLCMCGIIKPTHAMDMLNVHVPQAETVGQGRLRVVFWDIYDASLYAPKGKFQEGRPFALQLSYLRAISRKEIADHSISEIRRQGFDDEIRLADWHTQMMQIFPDVAPNTSLTGVYTSNGQTIFFDGNKEIGRIQDSEFGKRFFNIWLGQQTSVPMLRKQLLGQL